MRVRFLNKRNLLILVKRQRKQRNKRPQLLNLSLSNVLKHVNLMYNLKPHDRDTLINLRIKGHKVNQGKNSILIDHDLIVNHQ